MLARGRPARSPTPPPPHTPVAGPIVDPVAMRDAGDAARQRNNACYHAAFVSLRLIASGAREEAERLERAFQEIWGAEYDAMLADLVQEEEMLPPADEEARFQRAQE